MPLTTAAGDLNHILRHRLWQRAYDAAWSPLRGVNLARPPGRRSTTPKRPLPADEHAHRQYRLALSLLPQLAAQVRLAHPDVPPLHRGRHVITHQVDLPVARTRQLHSAIMRINPDDVDQVVADLIAQHTKQLRRHLTTANPRPRPPSERERRITGAGDLTERCVVNGCDEQMLARKRCRKHYQQWYRANRLRT